MPYETKRPSRRQFLFSSAATLAASVGGRPLGYALGVAPPRPPPKERRLLFNWDGSMVHCFGRAALAQAGVGGAELLTPSQFTALIFEPLADTPVDAIFFSFGSGNVAEYDSRVLEWPGEADRFSFPESKTWHGGIEVDPADQYKNPKHLADAGHNPPALVVAECRRRDVDAFVSFRMNDCHDGQHPKGTIPNPEYPTFKRINPDWLVEDLDWWSALNFAHPRVRALKLKAIEELFERWDFDGIELDWLRHTLYFPRGTEEENGHYLTSLLRDIRRSLDDRAARRGKPIEIAVRIPERVEWCTAGGFEVATWITEDLVDSLILGQGLTEASGVQAFRALMGSRRLPIYGSLYMYGNGYAVSPEAVVRGSAANLWHDGVDGVYTFNWFLRGNWRRGLLRDVAVPERLAAGSKVYTLPHRFQEILGKSGTDFIRYNTTSRAARLPLEMRESESARVLQIPAAEAAAQAVGRTSRCELWLALDHFAEGDQLAVALNGEALLGLEAESSAPRFESVGADVEVPASCGLLGFPDKRRFAGTFQALRLSVPPGLVRAGTNELSLDVVRRRPGIEFPVRVTRVELLVEPPLRAF